LCDRDPVTTHPLTDPAGLAAALGDPDLRRRPTLLDVRWDLVQGPRRDLYLQAHIPGAVFVDLDRALADDPGDRGHGRHPLPDAHRFCDAMRVAGVSVDRPVVVYDDSAGTIAARAWWLLRHYGHVNVTLLDGGLTAWTAAGHETVTGDPPTARTTGGDFTGEPGHMPILDADSAAALAAAPDGLLIDARAAERFRGDTEPIDPAAGHIPGARNRPTPDNLDASGRFRDPASLAAAFAALGADPTSPTSPTPVGTYCGSGVTAAHEVLALELAGIPAALYPGSWSEWSADPTRPIQTGDRD
jgi:thiosulfate/3-mercaptopyruvate sulfurtransferase